MDSGPSGHLILRIFFVRAAHSLRMTDSRIEFRASPIHGLGGFAAGPIAAGERVIEYVGQRITKQESLIRCEQNNEYIFSLDETHDLDGNVGWNPAKFINHSCAPNCDAEWADGRIWIVARRDIAAGEELTFNYGYELESFRDHPCHCGAAECAGYMVAEEYFSTVRSALRQSEKEQNPQQSHNPPGH